MSESVLLLVSCAIWITQVTLPFLSSFYSLSPGVTGRKLCSTTPMLILSQPVMKIKTKILTTARTLALPILEQNIVWEPSFKKLRMPSVMKLNGVVASVCACEEVL